MDTILCNANVRYVQILSYNVSHKPVKHLRWILWLCVPCNIYACVDGIEQAIHCRSREVDGRFQAAGMLCIMAANCEFKVVPFLSFILFTILCDILEI